MITNKRKVRIAPHLILGGTGFIGRHVALALAKQGHQVVIASRTPPNFLFPANLKSRVTWTSIDVRSADWFDLLSEVQSVHHYAWNSKPASAQTDPAHDLESNVIPVINLLEAMRTRAPEAVPIVFASSGGTVYGKLTHVPVEESHTLAPITAYGAAKAATEHYLSVYRHLYGLDCRVARISNPYGAGQDTKSGQGVVTAFIAQAMDNEEITVWGDGNVVRDFIHISDLAQGLAALAIAPATRLTRPFLNIGTGHGTSIRTLLAQIEFSLGKCLSVSYGSPRSLDLPTNILDPTQARLSLGWSASLTMEQGIERTIADLRNSRQLSLP